MLIVCNLREGAGRERKARWIKDLTKLPAPDYKTKEKERISYNIWFNISFRHNHYNQL